MVLVPCYRCNRYHRIVPLGNMLSHHKGIVLKSSRPSLPLKKAPPLTPALFNGLYTPFGSPVCGGQKPQERGRKPPSGARNRYALRLADQSGLRHFMRDGTAGGKVETCLTSKLSPWLCGMGPPGERGDRRI